MQHDQLELADTRAQLPSTGAWANQGAAAGWDAVSQPWAALSTQELLMAVQQCSNVTPAPLR